MRDAADLAFDLISAYRAFYGAHHHHKEQLAFSATGLYLTGVGVFFVKWPDLSHSHAKVVFLILACLAAVATVWFIWWQFRQREIAAEMVAACTSLAARWVRTAPGPHALAPIPHCGHLWPRALVRRLRLAERRRLWGRGPRQSELLTYFVMFVFSLILVVRIWTS